MKTDTKRLIILFTISIVLGFLLGSCKTKMVSDYAIKTEKLNYYVNNYKVIGDSIYFIEYNRDGGMRHIKGLKVSEVQIEEKK